MDNKETDKSQMNGSMKDMNQLHLEKITYARYWEDPFIVSSDIIAKCF